MSEENKEHNKEEIESWEGDPWYPILLEAHLQLEKIDPNYRITQIKEKFHGLRYYYDTSDNLIEDEINQMGQIVTHAENRVTLIGYKTGIRIRAIGVSYSNPKMGHIKALLSVLTPDFKSLGTSSTKNYTDFLFGSLETEKETRKQLKKILGKRKTLKINIFPA